MPAFDWPLTLFTLVTQLVLGAFAVLWVTDLFARQLAERRGQEYLTSIGVWLLGPLMAGGFLASLFHLGNPLAAYRALAHLDASWLSREVFFLGLFFAMGAVYAALWWRWREKFALRAAYGAVVAVVGGLGLAAMVAVYLLPAVPAWNGLSTPLGFLASTLLLGPAFVGAVFAATYRRHSAAGALEPLIGMHLRFMAVTLLAGAALAGAAVGLTVWGLARGGVEGAASLTLLLDEHGLLLAGRLVLLGVAVALAVAVLLRLARRVSVPGVVSLVGWLFGVILATELVGRLLFFATAVPLRPPGQFF